VSTSLRAFFEETTVADLLGEIAQRPAMAPANDRPEAGAAALAAPSPALPSRRTSRRRLS
jgi:hypothetical protein